MHKDTRYKLYSENQHREGVFRYIHNIKQTYIHSNEIHVLTFE